MERKRILIADNDPTEVQALRDGLVAAGYEVRQVDNGANALRFCREFQPHLVLAEVKLPKIDGHHLLRELKSQASTKFVPFVLMSKHRTVDERVHSMHLGVDDYISKPFHPDEVITRIEIILKELELLRATPHKQEKGFSGKLSEIPLVDILKTLEIAGKSAEVRLQQESREGTVYVKDGQVLDAKLENLQPVPALMRMFLWMDGTFRVYFTHIDLPRKMRPPMKELIYHGLTRYDRWKQIAQNLPPLQATLRRHPDAREEALSPQEQTLLHSLHGKSRIIDLVEASQFDDLTALQLVARLYAKGALTEVPLEEQSQEARKRPLATNGRISREERIGRMVASFLAGNGRAPDAGADDFRTEGGTFDRTQEPQSRRSDASPAESNKVYLNKSELLMIREKLAKLFAGDDQDR